MKKMKEKKKKKWKTRSLILFVYAIEWKKTFFINSEADREGKRGGLKESINCIDKNLSRRRRSSFPVDTRLLSLHNEITRVSHEWTKGLKASESSIQKRLNWDFRFTDLLCKPRNRKEIFLFPASFFHASQADLA